MSKEEKRNNQEYKNEWDRLNTTRFCIRFRKDEADEFRKKVETETGMSPTEILKKWAVDFMNDQKK